MKIGIYPGSFDPFHVGHNNIYEKSLKLFDKVCVARLVNPDKNKPIDLITNNYSITKISWLIISNNNLLQEIYNISYGKKIPISDIFVIRGFRNLDDIKYQQEQDYWLKTLNKDFQSIYIECDEQYKHISSTALKQLQGLNISIKNYLC